MIIFSNIFKTLKSFYYNLTQVIYIILGFSQLVFLCIYLEQNYLFLILIHLTLVETLFISYKTIHSKSILFIYSFYLLFKYIFSSFMFFYSSGYIDYYFLITFQLLFFFFNIETVDIYKNKTIKVLSFLFVLMLSISVFILNKDFFSFLFLIYLLVVFYILKSKTLKEQNRFCHNKQFTPNMVLRKITQLPISFASIIILTFIGLLYSLELGFISKIVVAFLFIFTGIYEYRQFFRGEFLEFDSSKVLKYYILSIVFSMIYFLLFWLSNIQIEAEIFKDYSINIFNNISNIAILNIASLFVILQLNYSKYGSSYLLYKILKSPILLIITFLPSLIYICSFYFLKLEQEQYNILPFLLILSYLSTLSLFFYTYVFMETHNLMKKLFEDVKYEDFNTYKNNIIQTKERNIDSILTITNRVINNNDTPTSHSLFFYLFCWVDINILHIKDQDRFYQTKKNNRFYDFFILIIQNIVTSNNLIQKNFLTAIKEMIMYKINSDNYMNYSLIYKVLFSYLKLSLENKNEEISKFIYDVIYLKTSTILLNLKRFELNESGHLLKVNRNIDHSIMFDFEEVFIRSLNKIKKIAIKNEQKEFLSHCRFNHSFFLEFSAETGDYTYEKWDGKVIEVYKKLRSIRTDIDKYVLKNAQFSSIYMNDYDIFFKTGKATLHFKYNDLIQKYVLNDLVHLLIYSIENDLIKSESDFSIFWSTIINITFRNKNEDSIMNLISVFTFLFDKLAEKYINNKEKNSVLYFVFQRVLQLRTYKEFSKETKNFINLRIETLLQKYPKLNDFINIDMSNSFVRIKDINLIKDYDIKIINDYQI